MKASQEDAESQMENIAEWIRRVERFRYGNCGNQRGKRMRKHAAKALVVGLAPLLSSSFCVMADETEEKEILFRGIP